MPLSLGRNMSISGQPPQSGTPQLSCDIVMKSGVTSVVVDPLALAEKYRFANISGKSAGAIAAATAVASDFVSSPIARLSLQASK